MNIHVTNSIPIISKIVNIFKKKTWKKNFFLSVGKLAFDFTKTCIDKILCIKSIMQSLIEKNVPFSNIL